MNLSMSLKWEKWTHDVNLSMSLDWDKWDSCDEFECVPRMGRVGLVR